MKSEINEAWKLENPVDGQRPGSIDALTKFEAWIAGGCPKLLFSVFMCCRYGKADLARNMVLLAIAKGIASVGLVIHPWPVLAQQFLEEKRLLAWRRRWLPEGPRLNKISTLNDWTRNSMNNGEWIGSIHIHALLEPTQRRLLLEWVDHCKHVWGSYPIIIFDEDQYYSTGEGDRGNKWGEVARELLDAGCNIVVMTATPFRSDGDDVFGFARKQIGSVNSRILKYVTRHPDPEKLWLHTSTRDESEYVIEADVEVPFSQGWEEGCIARATLDLIEWKMEGYGLRDGDNRILSELPRDEVRKVLPGMYRDPDVIREAVRRAVSHLRKFRDSGIKDATMLWYGMNDSSESDLEASENQKIIRDLIKDEDPKLSVAIATLNTDIGKLPGERSKDTISAFIDTEKKHYDALLLKQMGAAGLDSDRICVVVLWNTIRSLRYLVQAGMRGANATINKTHFVIIGLKDCITDETLRAFIDGEGGSYVQADETDHRKDEIPKEQQEPSGWIPIDVTDTGVMDTDGEVATWPEVLLAMKVCAEFPYLYSRDTIPKIAQAAKRMGVPITDDEIRSSNPPSFADTTKIISASRKNLGKAVKHIGKLLFIRKYGRVPQYPNDKDEWFALYPDAIILIKTGADVFSSWDERRRDRSERPEDYKKWTYAAEAIIKELKNEVAGNPKA